MKVLIPLLIVFALFLSASPATALDNPHNKVINCAACHQTPSDSWWTDQGAAGGVCGQCHYPGAPNRDAVTHQTSPAYGGLSLACTQCHNPHYQKQLRTWKSGSFLATGTISAADSATLTRAETSPGWIENQWRGMLLIPNVRYLQYSYRILSNTNKTITIDTAGGDAINTSTAVPGSAFAVAYGRLLKEAMNSRWVRFFGKTGAHSFADADATIDGVCQVCHATTTSFTAGGILEGPGHPGKQAGKDCTLCHSHTSADGGFVANCDACHGVPPVDAATLAASPGPTGSATAGAHDRHVNILGIDCASCHYQSVGSGTTHNDLPTPPQTVSIGFSLFGGTYTGGTYEGQNGVTYDSSEASTVVMANGRQKCSNIYCHGKFAGSGLNASPQWDNTAAAPCGSCHGASNTAIPNSGGHMIHAEATAYSYSCTLCHKNVVGGNGPGGYSIADQGRHVNGVVDWQFETADPRLSASSSYSIASGSKVPSNGTPPRSYGTCANTYCHSKGTSLATGVIESNTTPAWGAVNFPMACNKWTGQSCITAGCHQFGYIYIPVPPSTYSYKSCSVCHGSNTPGTLTKASYPSNPHKCYGCHRFQPINAPDAPKANSHYIHTFSFPCNYCHFSTTTDGTTIANTANHANGSYDVVPDPNGLYGGGNVNFTYAFDPGGGKCTNINCHITRGIGSWKSWGGAWVNVSSAWKSGPSCYEMIFYNVSASGGTPPYTYLWDFGDGTTSTEQNPTHVFPSGATYTVTVTARDANRHPGTKTAPVTPQPVNAAPVADMEVSVYGWTVTLTDKSYDTDYNTCGHSGPGTIEIMWGDIYGGNPRTTESINLTNTPSNRVYTHTYSKQSNLPNAQIFDLIRDNAGVLSQSYRGLAIPTTYTISGRVANAAGVGLNGAVIYLRTMSGAVPPFGTAGLFTNANGDYTFTGTAVDGECYLVKQPAKSGYTFTPAGDQTVCAASTSVNWTSAP